jgi:RNA polymerase sigma-70 factor, ECF subfamily
LTPEQLLFSQAIRPHLGRLDRFVAARVENQHVADICSDVIALAWQKRTKFNLEAAGTGDEDGSTTSNELLGFLLTAARFQIKNLERKVGNAHRLLPSLTAAGVQPSPEDSAIAGIAVSKAFKELKGADQELLAMFAWDGLNTSQVAAVLGISENNAGVRLNRARARFSQALERQDVTVNGPRKKQSE